MSEAWRVFRNPSARLLLAVTVLLAALFIPALAVAEAGTQEKMISNPGPTTVGSAPDGQVAQAATITPVPTPTPVLRPTDPFLPTPIPRTPPTIRFPVLSTLIGLMLLCGGMLSCLVMVAVVVGVVSLVQRR